MPDFPALPEEIHKVKVTPWLVTLPPDAAAHIGAAQYVFHLPDTGELVCPVAERVAVEWDNVRRWKGPGLTRDRAHRLLDVLTWLLPGPAPEGMSADRIEAATSDGWWEDDGEGDLRWVVDQEATERSRTAAAYILGAVLARYWRLRQADTAGLVRQATEAGISEPDAKVALCASGLLLAAGDEETPQLVRLRRQYVKGPDGAADVRPLDDISAADYLRWIFARALRHARDAVRKPAAMPDAPATSPLDALVAFEAADEAGVRVDELRRAASPQQRRLLDVIEAALQEGATPEEARRVAAESEGITASAMRTQLERLRKKMNGV